MPSSAARCCGAIGAATHDIECDSSKLWRDQAWFLSIFIVKLALGLLVFNYKPWLGAAFLLAYAVYLMRELRAAEDRSDIAPRRRTSA